MSDNNEWSISPYRQCVTYEMDKKWHEQARTYWSYLKTVVGSVRIQNFPESFKYFLDEKFHLKKIALS